jgi:hypothetical protein
MKRTALGVLVTLAVGTLLHIGHRNGRTTAAGSAAGVPQESAGVVPQNALAKERLNRWGRLARALQVGPGSKETLAMPAAGRPPALPLSYKDVPPTAELERAYRSLEDEYGPMFFSLLEGMLARRAQIATCGIKEQGAVWAEIHFSVAPDHKTMLASEINFDRNISFAEETAETARECIRSAVLHEQDPYVVGGPPGREMDDSDSIVVYDLISFPIEDDELYELFSRASPAAFHATQTKKKYGFPR